MSDCEDLERPEFMDYRLQRARRSHRCCECSAEIKKGQSYHRYAGKWNGTFCAYKICVDCQQKRQEIEESGCCVAFGCLQEVLDG